jgi:hypothetical protein
VFTASALWIAKVITTARTAVPTISPIRMPLIRVLRCVRRGAGTRGAGLGRVPLTDWGGRADVSCGALIALLLS